MLHPDSVRHDAVAALNATRRMIGWGDLLTAAEVATLRDAVQLLERVEADAQDALLAVRQHELTVAECAHLLPTGPRASRMVGTDPAPA